MVGRVICLKGVVEKKYSKFSGDVPALLGCGHSSSVGGCVSGASRARFVPLLKWFPLRVGCGVAHSKGTVAGDTSPLPYRLGASKRGGLFIDACLGERGVRLLPLLSTGWDYGLGFWRSQGRSVGLPDGA